MQRGLCFYAQNPDNQALVLALGGMMASLVFVATYFFKLPVSITQGYIHLGDGFILLGASLLGWASIPAAAIGSALADLLGGYTLYILPTFVIKGLVAAMAVYALRTKRPYWLTVVLLALAELVMVAGYFVTEWLFWGMGWLLLWALWCQIWCRHSAALFWAECSFHCCGVSGSKKCGCNS